MVIDTLTLGEKSFNLVKLTLNDLQLIQADMVNKNELVAAQLAKEEKLSKVEIFNIKMQIRTSKPTLGDVLAYSESATGAQVIIQTALLKANATKEECSTIINELDNVHCVQLAKELILNIPKSKAEEEK